jgi:hypothetical protein
VAAEFVEEGLGIGLEIIEGCAVMVVRDPCPHHTKQMILRLQVRRVRRQVDQLEPATVAAQQGSDLSGFLGAVDMGIVTEHQGFSSSRAGAPDECLAQGAEGMTIPMVGVAAQDRAVPPIGGSEEMAFPIGPRSRDLPLVAAAHPTPGEGRQQCQFRFIFDVQIYPRRRAGFERLGAALFP